MREALENPSLVFSSAEDSVDHGLTIRNCKFDIRNSGWEVTP
jgi:hypothetical protein